MKTNYLIVEDCKDQQEALEKELLKSPMTGNVISVKTGKDALARLGITKNNDLEGNKGQQEENPEVLDNLGINLVILELELSTKMYGMEVLSKVRESSTVPVVILTWDEAPERQTEAMERGATGYIHKRIYKNPIQIKNYLEVILERERSGRGSGCYSFDGWSLNAISRRLYNPDRAEVTLTGREFDLLLFFLKKPQELLPHEELIKEFGSTKGNNSQVAFNKLLSRLRKKIDGNRRTSYILTVHGKGCQFMSDVIQELWK